VWRDCDAAIREREPRRLHYEISNRARSVGARLSGEIARVTRDRGLPPGSFDLSFRGTAGQSFGAFCNRGMRLTLVGEAQDYVGKSMYGGEIVLRPSPESRFVAHDNVILGNTVLYGATGGSLFAAGRAGERLCVRNSGARAVVEGCGDHGCEYMTNGVAVILGPVGRNFAAGMSGGVAYVLDENEDLEERVNPSMATVDHELEDTDRALLRILVERHHETTDSARAAALLDDWGSALGRFRKVAPHPSLEEPSEHDQETTTLKLEALRAVEAARTAQREAAENG
jgi:glutamate synthase domain-containing protein 3